MVEYDDEGEEIREDAQVHITKFHFPEKHQHPSGAIIIKPQMFFFSAVQSISEVIEHIEDQVAILVSGDNPLRLEAVLEKEKKGQKVTEKEREAAKLTKEEIKDIELEGNAKMINAIKEYINFQGDYSVSVDGMGRRQGTGIAASQRTQMTPSPKKRSIVDRAFGRNKEDPAGFTAQG